MKEENKKINVDQQQYEYMSKYSENYWDPQSKMAELRKFNNVRVPFVCEQLEMVGKIKDAKSPNALVGIKILDVGCGGGFFTEALAELGANVVGLDPVDGMINVAREHLTTQKRLQDRVKYICETIEEHSEVNVKKYDVIVSSEVIEHVSDKKSFIKSCSKALKNDGDIFITTPNRTLVSFFVIFLWAEWILNIIPRGWHNFDWFIHHKKLEHLLMQFGILKIKVEGFCYFTNIKNCIRFKYLGLQYLMHGKLLLKTDRTSTTQ